jgi:uncharacterized protein
MSTDTPQKLIPQHLDPRKLAYQEAVFCGAVPVGALTRVKQAVAELKQVVANLEFRVAEEGEKVVQGTLTANVDMVCQRCLEPVATEISSQFKLAAVWNEDEAKQLPKAYDPWVTGEGEGDVYDILEEELLLSLPVVALHDKDCVDETLLSSGAPPAEETKETSNPFQVLKQLKGNIKK